MSQLMDLIEEGNGVERTTEQALGPRWIVLLKVHLVLLYLAAPAALAWIVWQTRDTAANEAERGSEERFTQSDGRELEDREREARSSLERSIDARLDSLEQQTARILVIVERIENNRN